MSSPGVLIRSQSLWTRQQVRGIGWGNLQFLGVGTLREITREEVEEGLHLGVEGLGWGG